MARKKKSGTMKVLNPRNVPEAVPVLTVTVDGEEKHLYEGDTLNGDFEDFIERGLVEEIKE